MTDYDLIVIGGGPGGYEAAAEAASGYGMKTALIEGREIGGTCLNRGCIPTKTMLHTALLYDAVRQQGEEIGLTGADSMHFDMEKIVARKNQVIEHLRSDVQTLMKKSGVTVFHGTGTILDRGTVRCTDPDGNQSLLHAGKILIATGSVPSNPPVEGAELPGVYDSTGILESDRPLKSLVIVGGGVIGMEFATVFGALGCEVTVLEAGDRIISTMDREFGQTLKQIAGKNRGIDIHTRARVIRISGQDDAAAGGLTCHYTEKDQDCQVSADGVLLAMGRKIHTEGLFDEDTSEEVRAIAADGQPIETDEHFMTRVPGIYAVGDVIGGLQLAHKAMAEGRSAVAFMNGGSSRIDQNVVPTCIYTDPEIASVGLSASEAKKLDLPVLSRKYTMGANAKSVLTQQERGFIRVIADKETHRLLGAQMICDRATDMISQFSQAISRGLTLEALASIIYPHPSFAEGIGEVCR